MRSEQELITFAEFDDCKQWINKARQANKTWEEIDFACKKNEEGLISFLNSKEDEDFWTIKPDEWHLLVSIMKKVDELGTFGFIGDPQKPVLSVPTNPGSCWNRYKEKLQKPGSQFTYASIKNIENTSQKIISQLELNTEQNDPVRGMVVGNVQSGKTANMAGVISMAADFGYNFFIILTGTIDNLRKQTRERLISDLNNENSNISFIHLDNLSAKTPFPDRLQDLKLAGSNKRYLAVCLKNSTRLKDLLNWMNMDLKSKEKLRIILIDDEADQAGVNTKDIDTAEQTAISRLIKNIVFGRTSKDQKSSSYQCMNYIGYTATPYANFLNETGNDTLYPKNFISLLNTSAEYFGPQQIFGVDGVNNGMNIVNLIEDFEVDIFNKDLLSSHSLPLSLKKALGWFLITVAIARKFKLSTPISMLIHTSQNVKRHFDVSQCIEDYFSQIDPSTYISELKEIYEEQISMFTLEDLKESMPEYNNIDKINDYPKFDDLVEELNKILSIKITHIEFDDNGNLSYNEGVHLCVDNCKKNLLNNEFEMRIVYPEKDDPIIDLTPAFIIVGGTTLSRGLTLKGLTTSYFLRSTSQADTLMQMGRWFGYRHKYELLPRLWLSNATASRFKRLTKLDYDLRDELTTMELKGLAPKDYAPRLTKFPDYKLLVLTSKMKMQSSIDFQCTFYNKSAQTTWFYRNNDILDKNYLETLSFLNSLGLVSKEKISSLKNPFAKEHQNPIMWFDIDYLKVLDFVSSLTMPEQAATFKEFDALKEWYKKEYEQGNLKNFTVIAGGVGKKINNDVALNNGEIIHLENRARFESTGPNHKDYNDFIDLKTITQSSERLMDVDCSNLSDFQLEELTGNKLKFLEKRVKYASANSPLLIIYIIDKDSGKNIQYKNTQKYSRLPLFTLGLQNHIVGYYIYIPYGNDNNSNFVTVKLNYEDDGEADIDED